jgi:hypothetical protein
VAIIKKKIIIYMFLLVLITLTITPRAVQASDYTLAVGNKKQLHVSTNKKITWYSSDTNVATVSKTGLVKCTGAGYVLIVAEYGNSTRSWLIKVIYAEEEIVYEYDISSPKGLPKKQTVYVGDKTTLKLNGIEGKAIWKTSNTAVATINKSGIITAKKKGTCTITAKVNKKSYTCKLTVKNRTLSVNKKSLKMKVGETKKIIITLTSNDTVMYTTGDASDTLGRYESIYEPLIDIEFGEWKGNDLPLIITANESGEDYIYISTENSKEELIVAVIIE